MDFKKILTTTLIVLSLIFINSFIVNAGNVFAESCGGVDTALIKCDQGEGKDLKDNGIWGLLLIVINILTAGVGIMAVGGIIYGSILYTSSGNSPDQIKKAKQIIINVVIGIVMYALMYSFLNFVIPGGIFS